MSQSRQRHAPEEKVGRYCSSSVPPVFQPNFQYLHALQRTHHIVLGLSSINPSRCSECGSAAAASTHHEVIECGFAAVFQMHHVVDACDNVWPRCDWTTFGRVASPDRPGIHRITDLVSEVSNCESSNSNKIITVTIFITISTFSDASLRTCHPRRVLGIKFQGFASVLATSEIVHPHVSF